MSNRDPAVADFKTAFAGSLEKVFAMDRKEQIDESLIRAADLERYGIPRKWHAPIREYHADNAGGNHRRFIEWISEQAALDMEGNLDDPNADIEAIVDKIRR